MEFDLEGIQLSQQIGDHEAEINSRINAGQIHLLMGEPERAFEQLQERSEPIDDDRVAVERLAQLDEVVLGRQRGDESASGPGTGQIAVTSAAGNVNGVRVVTRDSTGTPADRSFHLLVSC